MQDKYTVIDPPEGWRYGFPRAVPKEILEDDKLLKSWLSSHGYPKEKLELAMKHSRYWYV